MRKNLTMLVLGIALGLSPLGALAAESAPATPAVSTADGAQFLAWLNQPEPVPAATCTTSVRCYSTGQLLSCSGTTCSRFLGCHVNCDGIEYNCPPGGPFDCP